MPHCLVSMTRVSAQSLSLRFLGPGDSTEWLFPRKMALPSMYALRQGCTQDIMCFTDEETEVLARVGPFSQMEHLLVRAEECLLWVNLSYSYKEMKAILIITVG